MVRLAAYAFKTTHGSQTWTKKKGTVDTNIKMNIETSIKTKLVAENNQEIDI